MIAMHLQRCWYIAAFMSLQIALGCILSVITHEINSFCWIDVQDCNLYVLDSSVRFAEGFYDM
jgi:hypothetical protein